MVFGVFFLFFCTGFCKCCVYHQIQGGRWVFSELSPVGHPMLLGRLKLDVHFWGWGELLHPQCIVVHWVPPQHLLALQALAILQTHMVLFLSLFALFITYSKIEMPFFFYCIRLHPPNTPNTLIPAVPFSPAVRLWRALFKGNSKCT